MAGARTAQSAAASATWSNPPCIPLHPMRFLQNRGKPSRFDLEPDLSFRTRRSGESSVRSAFPRLNPQPLTDTDWSRVVLWLSVALSIPLKERSQFASYSRGCAIVGSVVIESGQFNALRVRQRSSQCAQDIAKV